VPSQGANPYKVVANSRHFDEELKPDLNQVKSWIWIRIKVKNLDQDLHQIQNSGALEAKRDLLSSWFPRIEASCCFTCNFWMVG
jgi:hypothetical protein